jgi:hypothetical protein
MDEAAKCWTHNAASNQNDYLGVIMAAQIIEPLPSTETSALKFDELYHPVKVREWLDYDPVTGVFTWKKATKRRNKPGMIAGKEAANGYIEIHVDRVSYLAHRVAFVWMTGLLPKMVDHINGDKLDNRWANLRDVSYQVNVENKASPQTRSKTGFLGVNEYKGRFRAMIGHNGRNYYSPTFDTPQEARAAYVAMKKLLHKGFVESRF